jgi:hypothetical protein
MGLGSYLCSDLEDQYSFLLSRKERCERCKEARMLEAELEIYMLEAELKTSILEKEMEKCYEEKEKMEICCKKDN